MLEVQELIVDLPKLFIGGSWVEPAQGSVIEVLSPATEEVIGRMGEATPADIDSAVAAARETFDAGVWADVSPAERAGILRDAADILESRSEDLVDLITAELGCPRSYFALAHIPAPIRRERQNGVDMREAMRQPKRLELLLHRPSRM